MKSFINKAMLTLVVFGLAIVSSFAMDTDPPTEPVKITVEMEVTEEVQPSIEYGYKISLTQCVHLGTLDLLSDCLPTNNGFVCTEDIGLSTYDLYTMRFDNINNKWVCEEPLRKPIVN